MSEMLCRSGRSSRHADIISHLLSGSRLSMSNGTAGRAVLRQAIRFGVAALLVAHPVSALRSLAAEPSATGGTASGPPLGDGPQALIAALRSRILASHSATLALESWCADYKLAGDPHLTAERMPVADKPLTDAQRARLMIGPDEPVRYRRVRLACGGRVLSEADNWYVPARLTAAMNATLDETRTPFGRVVRPLAPVRNTVEVRSRVARGEPGPDDPLFEVDAVLSTGAGQPFCEVVETYLGSALPEAAR
jgi:hypothetical protein